MSRVPAARTPESSTASSMSGEPLLRAIGTFGLAAAIVNITVGGGIFRLPSSVAGSLGAAAPIAYVVCAVARG
jgi:APA family basic amino acid/polyamine antiporter